MEDEPFFVAVGTLGHQKTSSSPRSSTAAYAFAMIETCADNHALAASVFPGDIARFVVFCTNGCVPYQERNTPAHWVSMSIANFSILNGFWLAGNNGDEGVRRCEELGRLIQVSLEKLFDAIETDEGAAEQTQLNAAMGAFAVAARIMHAFEMETTEDTIDVAVEGLEALLSRLGCMPPKAASKVS